VIRVQLVKSDLQDPKDRRVKSDLRDPKDCKVKRDRRDRRAIPVQLVKQDLKVRKDPKALQAQLVRLGQPLKPRSALLPDQTARLCAMKMRFWFRSSARWGCLMVQHVRREARRQPCACGSKPAR
jgi:hypothetical protein